MLMDNQKLMSLSEKVENQKSDANAKEKKTGRII